MTTGIHKKEYQPSLFETGAGYAEMYCDGASSGNPGPSGIGVVINLTCEDSGESGKNRSRKISEFIGTATNNVAEYSALLKGLETAKSMEIQKIKIFMDSELLVRQINGIYRVKNENLIPLWLKAKEILKDFSYYVVKHVPRELNKEADSLARRAITQKRRK